MNKKNVLRLADAVENSSNFDMSDHTTCLIGHAARLDGQPHYEFYSGNYFAKDLTKFLGFPPQQYDNAAAIAPIYTIAFNVEKSQAEAVTMLRNLAATGKVEWPQ